MEIISENIYKKAEELSKENYTELRKTNPLTECNAIVVSHCNKNFWFSTTEVANETLKKFKSNKNE